MNKIAILGANGFIGRELVEFLRPTCTVIPVTRDILDLTDFVAVRQFLARGQFDAVINCAASYQTDQTLLTDTRNNLGIFSNFYHNSNLFGKFINLGSGAEYDVTTNIDGAKEQSIFSCSPQDSYGFGHNIKSRLCLDKENFYTLRIFGCFGGSEAARRIIPKFLACQDTFLLENDRCFDFISVQDLCVVIKSFIENTHTVKDVNCVYAPKQTLSTFLNKFKEIHQINTKVIVKSTSTNSYTGDHHLLASLNIQLSGLDHGLKNYFTSLK
jgi:nucleoside-diphosphate-sugar epimerase